MTSKTTMVLEINELKARLKAKDEEFIKILDLCEAQEIISQIQNYAIKQRIKEE